MKIRSLGDAVAKLLHEDDVQARQVFGIADPTAIEAAVRAYMQRDPSTEVVGCPFDNVSVGVTLELLLRDDRRVVVKVLPRGGDGRLRAAIGVQRRLGEAGYCAPRVLTSLTSLMEGEVYMMEAADRGEQVRYDEQVRDTMARELARLVDLAAEIEPRPELLFRPLVPTRLWPTPHSAILDFNGTAPTAGRIDHQAHPSSAGGSSQPPDLDPRGLGIAEDGLPRPTFGRSVRLGQHRSDAGGACGRRCGGAAVFHQQHWYRRPKAYSHDFYPGPDIRRCLRAGTGLGLDGCGPSSAGARHDLSPHRLAYQARWELRRLVAEKLSQEWSPLQISG